MHDVDILIGSLVEDSWLTLEQVAAACAVDAEWLLAHLDEGLFPQAESAPGCGAFRLRRSAVRAGCGSSSAISTPPPNSPR